MRKIFLFFLTLQIVLLHGHGFVGNTSVHLANGRLLKIESLTVPKIYKKCIFAESYDYRDHQLIANRIKVTGKSKSLYFVHLGFDDNRANDIVCTPTQAFYLSSQQWVLAHNLCVGDELFGYSNRLHKIVYKQILEYPCVVYTLEVEKTHTFFVGKQGILTHNMVLPTSLLCEAGIPAGALGGVIGSLCSSPFVVAGAILIAVGCAIAKAIKRRKVPRYKIPVKDVNVYSDRKIYQTLDKRGDKRKKKRKQKVRKKKKVASEKEKKARNREHKPLTNEEAKRMAKELGYKEDKNPPFNSHNKPSFRKGNNWITPDRDGHKGGIWKKITRFKVREGTWNIDLTQRIGA